MRPFQFSHFAKRMKISETVRREFNRILRTLRVMDEEASADVNFHPFNSARGIIFCSSKVQRGKVAGRVCQCAFRLRITCFDNDIPAAELLHAALFRVSRGTQNYSAL